MLKEIRSTLIMIGECFRMSLSNIRGAKVRSFLTVLGILIGVMAVITLITTVNGVTGSISDSFFSMGQWLSVPFVLMGAVLVVLSHKGKLNEGIYTAGYVPPKKKEKKKKKVAGSGRQAGI